jgi:hypothetical protein
VDSVSPHPNKKKKKLQNFFGVKWSEGTVTYDELETMAMEAIVVCFIFPRVYLEILRKTTNSPRISGAAVGFRTSFLIILNLTFFSESKGRA